MFENTIFVRYILLNISLNLLKDEFPVIIHAGKKPLLMCKDQLVTEV
jgi:hypothetical protein